jgi:hypothetical protein
VKFGSWSKRFLGAPGSTWREKCRGGDDRGLGGVDGQDANRPNSLVY